MNAYAGTESYRSLKSLKGKLSTNPVIKNGIIKKIRKTKNCMYISQNQQR